MTTTGYPPSPLVDSVFIDPRFVLTPEGTATSFAAACLTSVIAATAGDAREMYSVSIVSFGAELGRPPLCLMFNKSHNITKRFPSRCFVIKSAELTVPRIFFDPVLLVLLFLLHPTVLFSPCV